MLPRINGHALFIDLLSMIYIESQQVTMNNNGWPFRLEFLFRMIWYWCKYLKKKWENTALFSNNFIANFKHNLVFRYPAFISSFRWLLTDIYDGTFRENRLQFNAQNRTRKERIWEKQGLLLKGFNAISLFIFGDCFSHFPKVTRAFKFSRNKGFYTLWP